MKYLLERPSGIALCMQSVIEQPSEMHNDRKVSVKVLTEEAEND